jgi:hypothetical protein
MPVKKGKKPWKAARTSKSKIRVTEKEELFVNSSFLAYASARTVWEGWLKSFLYSSE